MGHNGLQRDKPPKDERLRARAPWSLKKMVDAFLNHKEKEEGIEMSESELIRTAVRDYIKRNAPDLYLESMNQTTLEKALTEENEGGGRRESIPDNLR